MCNEVDLIDQLILFNQLVNFLLVALAAGADEGQAGCEALLLEQVSASMSVVWSLSFE